MPRLKIFIWHVHGSYLYYLSQIPHDIYVPSKMDRQKDYIGKWGHIPWPDNVHDVPVEEVKNLQLDCIIFQQPSQFLEEQYKIFSEEQRRLPKIYLEHDPPLQHPTDTKHFLDDPSVLLVHVTGYNALMWNCGRTPTTVIDHGVTIPSDISYQGEFNKGVVVINHLKQRGRRLGYDVYNCVREEVPLQLVGMGAEDVHGGLGEVIHKDLFEFMSHYRFFFSPIRYSSLALSTCEAMMIGLPIIGLATTELTTVIKNDVNGYIDTRVENLIEYMKHLLEKPREAKRLGEAARKYAQARFSIDRFIDDWNKVLIDVVGTIHPLAAVRR
jgi:glycosyltransferase involved in cell wall biosynthesis